MVSELRHLSDRLLNVLDFLRQGISSPRQDLVKKQRGLRSRFDDCYNDFLLKMALSMLRLSVKLLKRNISKEAFDYSSIQDIKERVAKWATGFHRTLRLRSEIQKYILLYSNRQEDLWAGYLEFEVITFKLFMVVKVFLEKDAQDVNQWREYTNNLFGIHCVIFFLKGASNAFEAISREAFDAFPESMSLRRRFVEILGDLKISQTIKLKEEIISGMKRDFAEEPKLWDWLARLQLDNKGLIIGHFAKAIAVYEEALTFVPSAKLFPLYTKFWMDAEAEFVAMHRSLMITEKLKNAYNLLAYILAIYLPLERCEQVFARENFQRQRSYSYLM